MIEVKKITLQNIIPGEKEPGYKPQKGALLHSLISIGNSQSQKGKIKNGALVRPQKEVIS